MRIRCNIALLLAAVLLLAGCGAQAVNEEVPQPPAWEQEQSEGERGEEAPAADSVADVAEDVPASVEEEKGAGEPPRVDQGSKSTPVQNGAGTQGSRGEAEVIANPDDLLVLVNKRRSLPPDYVPPDLVVPNVPFPFKEDDPKKQMRAEAARALEQLFAAAKEAGLELYAQSGYRSYERQRAIFAFNAARKGEEVANMTSAYPGQSEHQTGLAMDVTSPKVGYDLIEEFGETPEGKWLAEHAARYGFIIRYPKGKEHITGYSYEPWHLRYVGVEHAQHIMANNLTLEEYLGQQ